MHLIALAAGALLVALAGCGGARPSSSTGADTDAAAAGGSGSALDEAAIRRVIDAVSAARQLEEHRPIDVALLDRDAFLRAVVADEESAVAETELSPEAALLLGFDFVPPPAARAGVRGVAEVLAEQVAGFYDIAKDRIVIPAAAPTSAEDDLEQRAVLAHEVHHALQMRHFPALKEPTTGGDDARLARLALIEGDAQVAMGAYLALESGVPVGRAIRQILDVNREVPLGKVAHGDDRDDGDDALRGALDLTRERLIFPYEAGALFVTDLYRAGGFPLVDRAYAHPPQTTEQILHPEKFVAGEVARPIDPLLPPRGFSAVHGDALGELQARTLFRRCAASRPDADAAADGWGGDRFGVFTGPDRRVVMGWVTAWDTEADAREVEALLTTRPDCWTTNGLHGGAGDFTVARDVEVRRTGSTVVLVRGLDKATRGAWMATLPALVRPQPAATARLDARITERVPLAAPRPGIVAGDVWTNEWLGLVARIPAGLRATSTDDLDLLIERDGALVRGAVAFSDRVVSPRFIEQTFREVGGAIATEAAAAGKRLRVVRAGDVPTDLGPGSERVWRVEGTPVEIRMLLLPICAQTGSIVLVQAYADAHARAVLDGWFGSFRWIDGRDVPACTYLDPK